MVVDNSASMAGPPVAPKINTVKTIIGEQVSDLAPAPQGTEFNIYTFNAGNYVINPLLQGKFFAPQIMPAVNGIAANGADAGCPVPGLGALSQAIRTKYDGDAWLYTDGDSADSISPEQMRLSLNEGRIRASIVLLGGCGSPARKQPDVTGAERTYLGLAADGSQSSGIVPYMMTSLLSGGQFIYVAPDQLANAVDMVRAQLSHTAGAGRWSDYVSNVFTYRWDRLEPWEYEWSPAEDNAYDEGQLYSDIPIRVDLPAVFPFFGNEITEIDVFDDGFMLMNPCAICPDILKQYVNILDTELDWLYIDEPPGIRPELEDSQEEFGPQVHAYRFYNGLWSIISTLGIANYGAGDTEYRGYQVWLNHQTGEIRFQYDNVRNEAAGAEISLIDSLVSPGNLVVSKNDFSGATDDMGYKFTPAPPQPTKTYDVDVDPLIESVVFLQTGYSGDFAPMVVKNPNGSNVNCNDTVNVKCVTVHNKPGDRMVQFVQVDTNGQSGVFTAIVGVGPSGSGTFSFNALAASELQVSSPGGHTLPRFGAQSFVVDLGRPSSNGTLQGWLQRPNGATFGNPFTLFDDGQHDDGEAGDGRFGSNPISPPGAGAAYLWVEGVVEGVAFKRSDPAPFNFQPLDVWAVPGYDEAYFDPDSAFVTFFAKNQDSKDHCYAVNFTVPVGWWYSSIYEPSFCIAANQTVNVDVVVGRSTPTGRSGMEGEVTMTLIEVDDGSITGSASSKVALFRPPASIEFDNRQIGPIRPNGTDTVELTLNLHDSLGQLAGVSGPFNGEITVTGGSYSLPTGTYDNGRLTILFTAGNNPGTATISALAEGGLMAETTIEMAEPTGIEIELAATPIDLLAASQSALTVTVRDLYGEPAAGETVRLTVSDDDGDQGTIAGGDVFEGATNKNGKLNATFVKTPNGEGNVIIRAELLGSNGEVLAEANVTLYLSGIPQQLYLPILRR